MSTPSYEQGVQEGRDEVEARYEWLSRKASAYGKEVPIESILVALTPQELEDLFSDILEGLLQEGRLS